MSAPIRTPSESVDFGMPRITTLDAQESLKTFIQTDENGDFIKINGINHYLDGLSAPTGQCAVCLNGIEGLILIYTTGTHSICGHGLCIDCAHRTFDENMPCPLCRKPFNGIIKFDGAIKLFDADDQDDQAIPSVRCLTLGGYAGSGYVGSGGRSLTTGGFDDYESFSEFTPLAPIILANTQAITQAIEAASQAIETTSQAIETTSQAIEAASQADTQVDLQTNAIFSVDLNIGIASLVICMEQSQRRTSRQTLFIALLDTSGSMCGTPLQLAKQAFLKWIEAIDPSAFLTVMTFNTYTKQIFPAQQINSTNLERIKQMIDAFRADGSTNLIGALAAANAVIENFCDTLGVDRSEVDIELIILSDGNPDEFPVVANVPIGCRIYFISLMDALNANTLLKIFTEALGASNNRYLRCETASNLDSVICDIVPRRVAGSVTITTPGGTRINMSAAEENGQKMNLELVKAGEVFVVPLTTQSCDSLPEIVFKAVDGTVEHINIIRSNHEELLGLALKKKLMQAIYAATSAQELADLRAQISGENYARYSETVQSVLEDLGTRYNAMSTSRRTLRAEQNATVEAIMNSNSAFTSRGVSDNLRQLSRQVTEEHRHDACDEANEAVSQAALLQAALLQVADAQVADAQVADDQVAGP